MRLPCPPVIRFIVSHERERLSTLTRREDPKYIDENVFLSRSVSVGAGGEQRNLPRT